MKVVSVVGARPQFIKAAPVCRALRAAGAEEVLVHTGQHYDFEMAEIFFQQLDIPRPDVNLEVGSGTHAFQTGQMLMRLEEVLLRERPDWVLVYGDTNSTLAGALAASKLHLRVAHVEAGMRSYNRRMPEEINRVVADHLSTLLFSPTRSGIENLRREGITDGVLQVGDVMYDALLMFLPVARERSGILGELGLRARGYALLTIHRADNVDSDERLKELVSAIGRLELPVVFPVHPRTRKRLQSLGLLDRLDRGIRFLPPVGYLDMLALEDQASLILTDSGGVQREAFFLSVPSIILRSETEWPELLEVGASVLAGDGFQRIATSAPPVHRPHDPRSLFGDGNASGRIATELARAAKGTGAPE